MAVQQTQTLPPQFVQDLGTDLAKQILAQTGVPTVATGITGISQQPGESAADFASKTTGCKRVYNKTTKFIRTCTNSCRSRSLQQQSIAEQQAGVRSSTRFGTFQPFLDRAQDQSADKQEQLKQV